MRLLSRAITEFIMTFSDRESVPSDYDDELDTEEEEEEEDMTRSGSLLVDDSTRDIDSVSDSSLPPFPLSRRVGQLIGS